MGLKFTQFMDEPLDSVFAEIRQVDSTGLFRAMFGKKNSSFDES